MSEKQKGSTKSRIQERALHWYRLAWKGLADAARDHARSRFRTALSRSGGPPSRKPAEAPDRWEPGIAKDRILVDDAFARGGRYSVKLPAVQGRGGSFTQKVILAPGRKYVFTAWVLTDRTDHPAPFTVTIWHGAGSVFEGPAIPLDQPWWTQVEATYECPANTESLQIAIRSKDNQSGNVWVDDLSLKGVDDDIELLENGSFEK